MNDPLNATLCTPEDELIFGGFQDYDDEKMWNYEAGIKSTLGDNITFNAAAFYSDIEDLQVTLDAGSCSSRISFNVPEAHTSGIEFEFGATPLESLEFTVAGSFVESEFDTTVTDATGSVLGGVAEGVLGSVWAGAELAAIRGSVASLPGACVGCAHEATCRGGCRGWAHFLAGGWDAVGPDCISSS